MNDYTKDYFVVLVDENTKEKHYFFRIKKQLVEVNKDVYNACWAAYNNDLNEMKRRAERPIYSLDLVDDEGHTLYDIVSSNYETEREAICNILISMVQREIAKLNDYDKQIMLDYFFLGLSQSEIARKRKQTQQFISKKINIIVKQIKETLTNN